MSGKNVFIFYMDRLQRAIRGGGLHFQAQKLESFIYLYINMKGFFNTNPFI